MQKSLIFNIALGKTKPENIRGASACPFCDVENLTNILAQEGHIIWLMNKYPVLKNTWPTILIETDNCAGEFSRFSLLEATRIIDFSIRKWEETMARPEFKSVIYFKNYGPMSGGSLRHPHSQIIGLYDYDYREDIKPIHFEGLELFKEGDLEITLSSQPIIGLLEFNLKFPPTYDRKILTHRMQQVVRYVLNEHSKHSASYNIFFYKLNTPYYYCKIVPRFLVSPLFVGYHISQVGNDENSRKIKHKIQEYFI